MKRSPLLIAGLSLLALLATACGGAAPTMPSASEGTGQPRLLYFYADW